MIEEQRLAKCKLIPGHRDVGSLYRCFKCCLRAMCLDDWKNWKFCAPRCYNNAKEDLDFGDGFCELLELEGW